MAGIIEVCAGRVVSRGLARWLTPAAVRSVLALADQAVVSGVSFLTTVLIGRLAGPDELGLYSLGFSLVLLVLSVQQSLVTAPYTVYCHRTREGGQAEYAGSVLLHSAALMIVAMLGLAGWSLAAGAGFGPPRLAGVVWVLVGTAPCLLLRDFARGYALAHLRVPTVLALDGAVAAGQVIGLAGLAVCGRLTAGGAFLVMGLSCLPVAAGWLVAARREFAPRPAAARGELRRSWSFAKWVFAGQMVANLNSDVFIVWLLAVVLGKGATGVFAACFTVVLFSNPFILGVNQILTPQIAHAFAAGGRDELRRVARKADLLVVGVMSLFCLVVMVWGGTALRLIYGAEYAGHQATVTVLALAILASNASMGAGKGLWVLDRPDANLMARLVGLAVTVAVASCLIGRWEVFGVACGWLAGSVADSAARYIAFARLAGAARPEGEIA